MEPDAVDRIVEQWARERPALQTEAMGILGRVYRIAAAGHEAIELVCARHGISRADYDVLATLRRSGAPFSLSPGALAKSMMLTTGGMTARLDRLEHAGLVTRSPGPGDRRSQLVTLTDRGRELIDHAVDEGAETQRRLFAQLSPRQRRELDELLRRALAGATAAAAGEPGTAPR